jgi:glycosyltransferase involved in cell wall biosynthesis
MTRILAFAYACDPHDGSEPGAGWAWARTLARLGETWVITRRNNQSAIEAELGTDVPDARLHFVYVDLPSWARFWKRGQHGVHLYYVLWQLAALRTARRLDRRLRFSLVWHLTFANVWLGSTAALVGPPFVYGPVGGGLGMPPRSLLLAFGVRGLAHEVTRASSRTLARYANPLARLAWRRARLILVQNDETRAWLPAGHRQRAIRFPNPILRERERSTNGAGRSSRECPVALYAGRLTATKGVALAIRAVAASPPWQLIVCGAGPDERRLRRLATRSGASDRVQFIGSRPRREVLALMRDGADVLLFPSLREEAGWVVVEALVNGLPVICLDRGAPPTLAADAGLAAPTDGDAHDVVVELSRLLEREHFPSQDLIRERGRYFSSESTFERLSRLLRETRLLPVEPQA